MKIKSKSSNKKVLVLALSLGLLLLIVSVAALYHYKIGPFANNSPNTDVSKEEKDKANNSDQTNNQQKATINSGTTSKNVDTTQTTDQIPTSTGVLVSIKNLSHENGTVSYTADVTGATTGTCSAVFTSQMGKPVTRTTDTSSGVCSASISEAEFDALGTWTLSLRFYSNNTQANASKDVVIN